jgi:hypothetical protein
MAKGLQIAVAFDYDAHKCSAKKLLNSDVQLSNYTYVLNRNEKAHYVMLAYDDGAITQLWYDYIMENIDKVLMLGRRDIYECSYIVIRQTRY